MHKTSSTLSKRAALGKKVHVKSSKRKIATKKRAISLKRNSHAGFSIDTTEFSTTSSLFNTLSPSISTSLSSRSIFTTSASKFNALSSSFLQSNFSTPSTSLLSTTSTSTTPPHFVQYKPYKHQLSNTTPSLISASTSRISTLTKPIKPSDTNKTTSYRAHFAAPATKNVNNRDGQPGNMSLTLEGVTKKLETGRVLFSNITTSFYHGAKIGIVGKNGSGKSSLLKILAGLDKNIDGKVEVFPGRVVGYLAQEPVLDEELSVIDNVLLGVKKQADLLKRYDEIADEFGNDDADIDALIDEQAAVQAQIEEQNCWHLHREIEVALEALCCPPPDHTVADCSGGQKRRVALAKLLLSKPDVLLLDEPTNHLDSGSVQWLEQYLSQYEGLVVAITHDRYFLDNVAGYILEIENSRFFPFKGNYTGWVESKTRRLELEASHQKALDKNLEREMEWMNKNAKGRQSKGKARVRKVEDLQAQKAEYRTNRVESGSLVIPSGPRLGGKVITTDNLGLAYNSDAPNNTVLTAEEVQKLEEAGLPVPWVFRNVNFVMHPGQVMGIIGPNGIGKTTLFKTLLGIVEPTAGTVHRGQSVVFGYNAQTREGLNPNSTVWEEIAEGQDWIQVTDSVSLPARQYVAQFNFTGQDQSKQIKLLSGGERNRVHLAKSLKRGTNVILLDEPTNDLDVDTLRSLEEAINSFDGCAFIVSHDRWFLDRVCTDILAFANVADTELGQPIMSAMQFAGNYSEFERYYRETTGQEYVVQKSKKFRGLMD